MSKSKARVPSAVTKSTEGVTPLAEQAETPSVSSEYDTSYIRVRFIDPIPSPDDTTINDTSVDSSRFMVTVDESTMTATVRSLDVSNPIAVTGKINHVLKGRKASKRV